MIVCFFRYQSHRAHAGKDSSFSAYINTVLKRILKNKAEQSQENKTE